MNADTSSTPPTADVGHAAGAARLPRARATNAARPRAVLVVNTHSRSGRRLYAQAQALLARGGLVPEAHHSVRDPQRLPDTVRSAVAAGMRLVIVGGGDGTISSVVDELAYRDVVLGILPLGTANSFARTLNIPLALEAATDVILRGRVAAVDLGKIGNDYFANTAALGLSSAIARSRLIVLKRYLGWASYPIAGAVKFFAHGAFRCVLIEGERRTSMEAFEVLIANGCYQGGALVAPQASIESRDLLFRIVKGPAKLNFLKAWVLTALGRTPGPALVEMRHAADLRIDAVPPQHVSIDGEVVTRTPIRASVAPDALKVLVGPDYRGPTQG